MTLHIKHVEPYTRLGIEVNYIVMTSSLEVYELSNELGVLDVISEHSPCTVKYDSEELVS